MEPNIILGMVDGCECPTMSMKIITTYFLKMTLLLTPRGGIYGKISINPFAKFQGETVKIFHKILESDNFSVTKFNGSTIA